MSQLQTKPPPDIRVEAGYIFPAEQLTVTEEQQRRLHGYCDIPPERYGPYVDPTFLARRPIPINTDSIAACHPTYAKIHTVHRIRMAESVKLGETVTMTGGFTAVTEAPRGWIAHSRWSFCRADGTEVMTVEPQLLMGDPGKTPSAKSTIKPAKAVQGTEPPPDKYQAVLHKQCTPESTLGYCQGSTNLIHLDPDYAKSFGFRAPIIAGNQTVNFLLEALALDGIPAALDVEIRFLRPVFWDDAVVVRERRDANGMIDEVEAVDRTGRRLAVCAVDRVAYL